MSLRLERGRVRLLRQQRRQSGRHLVSPGRNPTSRDPSPPHPKARAAAERGQRAELCVAEHLQQLGYSIVALNLRVGRLELDVVARLGDVIAVVEVRTRGRGAWTSGFGSIDGKKRQLIRRAGERLWQRRYKSDPSVSRLRFDAASVTFDEQGRAHVEHVPAAF